MNSTNMGNLTSGDISTITLQCVNILLQMALHWKDVSVAVTCLGGKLFTLNAQADAEQVTEKK
jgi:hypothetical protein